MTLPLLKDADVKGKRVLVRVDFNVPMRDGKVADDEKIKVSLPTIRYLLKKKAKIILMSHLGRPKGKVVKELRADAAAERLSKLLKKDVEKVNDCVGENVKAVAYALHEGSILMLENLRFHIEEEKNDHAFAKQLAELAEVYVNDAFASWQPHASVIDITKFLPSYAGLALQKEIESLTSVLESPTRPFVAVLGGGVKISEKINVVRHLLAKADLLLIGGAMMFTFLKALGKETGKSLIDKQKVAVAKELLPNDKIILPVDAVVADSAESNEAAVVSSGNIPSDKIGLDIGPDTVKLFAQHIATAKSILWNGPMGVFEVERFFKGTSEIAKTIAASKATTIIGGGDTLAAVERLGIKGSYSHISTGGGAMLKFLEGKELPAIAALQSKST